MQCQKMQHSLRLFTITKKDLQLLRMNYRLCKQKLITLSINFKKISLTDVYCRRPCRRPFSLGAQLVTLAPSMGLFHAFNLALGILKPLTYDYSVAYAFKVLDPVLLNW